ncbi:hypothetical protein KK103_17470 [Curtobacterium flaccumfaciens pv. flaccumfaciens]|uniref:Uncharacterized protein n=1 Tax=Curtobacterium flaccumfaciens pv. flaccumfaciens TaxID=138532 RepID=A0A9Q2W9T7_9MICO|nr:hypothetical protein [Curtobacterium flaccumfaciens]MBT1543555.1 hypothetical protein [Curtobacterium flaccumfaciens pv. flaccumfaciens]
MKPTQSGEARQRMVVHGGACRAGGQLAGLAAVIDEVGPDVTGWQVGDEVMAMALPLSAHGGAYVQELKTVRACGLP